MKVNVRVIIIAIACIGLICGAFFLFSQNLGGTDEKELTEVEKLITKDLKKNYPDTPREVVKLYNRILCSYHDSEITNAQLEKLVDQMMCLFDEDLLTVNPRAEYLASVKNEIKSYKAQKKYIIETDVCSTDDVRIYPDDKGSSETEKDMIAYVQTSYFVKTDGQFTKTYQDIVLRQDENGDWKLIAFYQVDAPEKEDE